MDKPERPVDVGQCAQLTQRHEVIATHAQRNHTGGGDRSDGGLDPGQCLLDVAGNGRRVPVIDDAQVAEHLHTLGRVVGAQQCRDAADRLRAVSRAAAERRRSVPGDSDDGAVHVLQRRDVWQSGVGPRPGEPRSGESVAWFVHRAHRIPRVSVRPLDTYPMDGPTLSDLVSHQPGVRVLSGNRLLRTAVRSVHSVDLEQPGRYLLPGEFVLTNGLWVGRTDPGTWAADVAAAGGVAIGFGLGTPHAEVPEALIAACGIHELALLEIPETLSFSVIQDAFAERVTRDHALGIRRHLARTRTLLQDLTEGRGHRALLDTLRRETGLDAAFIGPGGRLLASAGAEPDAADAAEAEACARRGELPALIGSAHSAFGAPSASLPTSTLVVGVPLSEVSDEARLIIDQVVVYAALEDTRARERRKASMALTLELLDLARRGDLTAAGFTTRLRALDLDPEGPLCVVASLNDLDLVAYAAEGSELRHVFARQDDTTLLVAAPAADRDVVRTIVSIIEAGGDDPVVGAGSIATGAEGLRRSLREALSALALARSRAHGARVVDNVDIGSHVVLLDLVEPDVLDAFRRTVLGPVERWDADHATALVGTLRAFLQSGGRWRETARALHVHHNTLRHRLARVEELTGRNLENTGDRVDFQLALTIPAQD